MRIMLLLLLLSAIGAAQTPSRRVIDFESDKAGSGAGRLHLRVDWQWSSRCVVRQKG